MTIPSGPIKQEALDWLIRQNDEDTADWPGFESWIGGDPARADAYWQLAAADADTVEALAIIPGPVAPGAQAMRRRSIFAPAWGIAASFALIGLSWWAVERAPGRTAARPYAVETAVGTTRSLTLPDGTRITMNGDTRLLLDRAAPRSLRLERGEASFTVVHDPRQPFSVSIGDATVSDVGTSFDVVRDADGVRIAVAQGAVRYAGGGVSRALKAGDTLDVSAAGDTARVGRIEPSDVAAWRQQRLVYDGARFAVVASDLARGTGQSVSVEPAIADRRFSGGIRLGADKGSAVVRAAEIMGIEAERRGSGWLLTAGSTYSQ
jgi:transmembrane sensor